eukprot:m.216045 g.216045  ORF g.216045 m.216045 type:complete len:93 (-) comp19112_c0_seq18:450-728(-)
MHAVKVLGRFNIENMGQHYTPPTPAVTSCHRRATHIFKITQAGMYTYFTVLEDISKQIPFFPVHAFVVQQNAMKKSPQKNIVKTKSSLSRRL